MEPKDDEEISIDFSRIKNFFKSEKKENAKEDSANKTLVETSREIAQEEEKQDEEISIDFSKIKNFFKSEEKKATSPSSSSDEEISLDWSRIAGFFKKYGIVFLALIPIILSIYVRMIAGFLPATDDWAQNSVINNIRSQIRAGIDQQYPNLPDANKNALVDTELQKVLSQNKQRIDEQIKATSNYFKTFFQDNEGKNYMPDIDPYYWFRYAKNIVEHGNPGDILKDGKPYDNHQLAPIGRVVAADRFHSYFLAYFYRALHFFVPSLTIMRSMFYYPVFVSALCVLLVFLIAKRISNNIGGFFAGSIMAINAAFLGRTLFGHADSDAWVVFFPLLITWLFLVTIDTKKILKVVMLMALAGFFTGLFPFVWSGWWFIFDFLLATIAVTFLYQILTNINDLKDIKTNLKSVFFNTAIRNTAITGFVYFLSTAMFVILFSGWSTFKGSFLGPLSFPSIKAPLTSSLWPNVLTTVAELNEGSINGIINSIGGQFLFYISLLGLILAISRIEGIKKSDFVYMIGTAVFYGAYFLFRRLGFDISIFGLLIWMILPNLTRIIISIYKKDSSYDFKLSILLSLWMVSTIFASIKGIRFTLLLAPAFSVAFGVALGRSYLYISNWLSKELKIHKLIGSSIIILLFLLLYVNPIRGAINTAGSDIPIVNDAWYNALTAIKQNSSQSAIITSWWDFGHHFKAIADRGVTFDGTTQTTPSAHWVGKLLMTDNEALAVGILRMLDCGNSKAHDELYKINNDFHLSLNILNKIILMDKDDAEKELRKSGLSKEQAENILRLTHCKAPEAYVITSEDMIGKSGVWSHFGSWNFERGDIWLNARKMPQEKAVEYMMNKFNYTKERAENTYYETQAITSDSEANSWVAPWSGYGGVQGCTKNKNEIYACSNGFQINLTSYDVFAIGQQGIVRPKVAAFPTEDGLFKKEFNGTTVDFGMTIIPKNENDINVVLSSKELAGGMFTRMFYMQGHGLRYFKLFNHQRGLTGTDIYTYKVDWEGKNEAIVQEYVDYLKPKVNEEKQENLIEI